MLGNTASPTPTGMTRGARRTPRLLAAVALVGALSAGQAAFSWAGETAPHGNPAPTQATSPFTGLPAEPAPVLAVKIDNHKGARPQTALEDADIVFVEKVEGGLSRLLGLYSSKLPAAVGPVRSAREYNIEQLRMFGRPALAYSGARAEVVDMINASTLHGVSHEDFPDAYYRGTDHEAPHNLYGYPDKILQEAPEAGTSDDIGFRFADDAPAGGTPTTERAVDYGAATTSFTWSAEEDRWLTSFDDAPATSSDGDRLGGKTIVVQKVAMPPDSSGETPYEETVGTGSATVLRDGQAYETTWDRPTAEAGTTFTQANGEPMTFDRGQVWVVYEEAK
ncbi:DUF3048 domain-containing protein [Streptomyces sp. NBC_01725]|uniref:DUF3048 domain-containing protein n=1 Tax=Streptomyces sp. NBC_01725 TaxID=2975923 RepID=UPI002E2E3AFC|nr:DUF3048 domain-containing protein [Streptomyces sp. NBC_01725]